MVGRLGAAARDLLLEDVVDEHETAAPVHAQPFIRGQPASCTSPEPET